MTHPNESTIFARATDMCILALFDTARDSSSCGDRPAVAAATTISLRTPVWKVVNIQEGQVSDQLLSNQISNSICCADGDGRNICRGQGALKPKKRKKKKRNISLHKMKCTAEESLSGLPLIIAFITNSERIFT